jgi:RNA polymerase sigma factor (sigma-70 family)
MATEQLGLVLQHLRKLIGRPIPDSDGQLLEQFVVRHDEQAFSSLVKRHGPMVLGVCRAVLRDSHDAEDAFQATFLVLVRRAASLDTPQSLGGWLHAVALRIALKARATAASRRERERLAMKLERSNLSPTADAHDYAALHEELERLPKKYRWPLILCYLQDKTHEEAARELGWPVGSMSWYLGRGRELLRKRLERRGLTVASPALVAMMVTRSPAALPAALLEATFQAALLVASGKAAVGGALSVSVAGLTRSACLAMTMARLKIAGIALMAAGMLTTGIVVMAVHRDAALPQLPGDPDSKSDEVAHARETPTANQPVLDGPDTDPLPPGAVARLGSTRMRPGHVVGSLAFSPDGKRLVSGNWGPGIHVWDAATGKELRRFAAEHQGLRVVYLPDGKTLASVGTNDKVVQFWDAEAGAELRQLVGHEGNIRALAPAPDGKTIASAGYDKTVRLWQVATGKQIRHFDHSGSIWSLDWSHDGKVVAAGTEGGQVCLWESDTGKLLRELRGHQRTVSQLAWSPDDRVLASGGSDGTIRLWDPKTGQEMRRLGTGPPEQVEKERKKADADKIDLSGAGYLGWVHGLAFSRDGKLLYSIGQDYRRIFVWDVSSGKELRRLEGPQRIFCLAGSADRKTLAVGGAGQQIDLWDLTAEKRIHPLAGPQGRVDAVAFSPDGKVLATAGDDQDIRIWEAGTWRELQRLPRGDLANGEPVGFLRFSADGKWLGVCAPPCSHVFVWDWAAKKEVRRFVEGRVGSSSHSLAFSSDGKMLATPFDGVTVWDMATGKALHNFECRSPGPGYAYSLEFSPDGHLLATGTIGTIYLCEPITGQVVRVFEKLQESVTTPSGHKFPNMITGLAFSADGKSLLSGAYDAKLRLWETATGKQRLVLEGHEISIQSVAISPNGKYLASGSGSIWDHHDNTVRLWDAATGKELRRFTGHQNVVVSIAFSADGSVLASGSEDGTTLIWDASSPVKDTEVKRPSAKNPESLWADLASDDAAKAYQAMNDFTSGPMQTVAFLKKNLQPASAVDARLMAHLISDLDNDRFPVRQKAAQELENLGELAESALRKEFQGKPSEERRRQIERLLGKLRQSPTCIHVRMLRAIEVLEHVGTVEARDLLSTLSTGAPAARLTQEAKSCLERLQAGASRK